MQRAQPVGENRLPLFAVSLVICLFTSAMTPARAKLDYSRSGYRSATVYTESDRIHWRIGELLSEAQGTAEMSGLRFRLNLAHSLPDGDLRWGYTSSNSTGCPASDVEGGRLSGRIFFQETCFQTRLSVESLDERLLTSLGWRRKTGGRHELSAAVWLQPTRFLGAGFKRCRRYPLPSYSELFYEYEDSDGDYAREGGKLIWQASAWVTEVKLRLAPMDRIVLEGLVRGANTKPEDPKEKESPPGSYLGVFDSLLYEDFQVGAEYRITARWSATAGYRQIRAYARLRAYEDGKRFAHFGVVSASGHWWSLKLSRKDWLLRLCAGREEGELDGVVEARPFVEGLLRFLGERRHFVGRAEASWTYASCGGPVWTYRRLKLGASLDYLHISPDVRYVTWRPKAFGFGYDDLRSDRLDLVRADLMRLQLKPVITWDRLRVEFDVSQWVPLSTKKTGQEYEVPDEGTPSGESKRVWGGFSASVKVRRDF